MRYRVQLAAFLMVLIIGHDAGAWNEVAHRLSVSKAIDALPKQMKGFYKQREHQIQEWVMDPARMEPRLAFEVDRLEEFPFEGIPEDREAAIEKYGAQRVEEAGDLPWRLIDTEQKLVEAFRSMDVPAIESLSAEIAYLAGELQMPLNVSKYGDGEPIGQEGLRERFDSRLLEVYGDKLQVPSTSSIYLDRPGEYAISFVRRSYVWVDNILLHDYIARQGVTSYDRFYYEGLWLRVSVVLETLLGELARDVSSFWHTAWVDAGKPELPKK